VIEGNTSALQAEKNRSLLLASTIFFLTKQRGTGILAVPQPSKLMKGIRFSCPAPIFMKYDIVYFPNNPNDYSCWSCGKEARYVIPVLLCEECKKPHMAFYFCSKECVNIKPLCKLYGALV
jgi:hypothetical protein